MLFTPIPFRLEHSGAMESLRPVLVSSGMDELARKLGTDPVPLAGT